MLMRGDFCGWRGHVFWWAAHQMGMRWESKVISPPPCMRTLVWWREHLVMWDGCKVRFEKSSQVHLTWEVWWWRGHLVMLDGHKVTFEKSSCVHLVWELWCGGEDTWSCEMDARWDFKSHLMGTSCENFGVVELTFGHARWMRGEIWKVISRAPWWRGHLVTLDGCVIRWNRGVYFFILITHYFNST